jgi:hypothetical protein
MKFFECPNCGSQVAEPWEKSSTIFMLSTNKSCSNCNKKIGLNLKILFTLYLMAFLMFFGISVGAVFLNNYIKSAVPYSGYYIFIIWGILICLINFILPCVAGNLMQKRIFIQKPADL